VVLVDEGEAGAGYGIGHAQAGGESLNESGLAGSEVAVEADEVAGGEMGGEAGADGAGLVGRA